MSMQQHNFFMQNSMPGLSMAVTPPPNIVMMQQQQQQAAAAQQQQQHQQDAASEREMSELYALVLDLTHPDNREAALLELSKKRETVPDLAPILWHSVGTIAVRYKKKKKRKEKTIFLIIFIN
jgi:hypothetical protein